MFPVRRDATGVVALSIAAAIAVQASGTRGAQLTTEGGLFENLSVAFFAAALAVAVWSCLRQCSLLRLSGIVVLGWAILRELDFQKRFTYRSVESLGYYTRADAPLSEKLLVLLILAPVALAGLYLAASYFRRLVPALARGEPWVGHTFAATLLVMIGTTLEKLFEMHPAEEVCETGLALVVLLLVWESRVPAAGQIRPATTTPPDQPADMAQSERPDPPSVRRPAA